MKMIGLGQTTLEVCIKDVAHERVVITRNGKPIALMVSVKGMDEEQLQLGSSVKFWGLVEKWRKEKTISRAELEQKLNAHDKAVSRSSRQRKSSLSKRKQMA
jgi:antitoxin (DNA-binding transcriptional repressor) of toxin-antitoxin stability system